jgi:hypothetical protein
MSESHFEGKVYMKSSICLILSFILVTTQAFAQSQPTANANIPVFKIHPRPDNMGFNDKRYIGFMVLPNNTVWFFACESGQQQCDKIVDKPIEMEKFMKLKEGLGLSTKTVKVSTKKSDFIKGAVVTHLGGSLLVGLTMFGLGIGAPAGFGVALEGASFGLIYLMSPLGTALALASGSFLVAPIGAGVLAVGGVLTITVAALGGLGYMAYRTHQNSKLPAAGAEITAPVGYYELISIIQKVSETPADSILILPKS